MIYSKVMEDIDDRDFEGFTFYLKLVETALGGWDPVQHPARRWEYTMMMAAYSKWCDLGNVPNLGNMPGDRVLNVADVGCGIGLSPILMLMCGHNVTMYEPWVYGDESVKLNNQIVKAKSYFAERLQSSRKWGEAVITRRPLCELLDSDRNVYDVVNCISTMEHIGEYMRAWKDLLSMVKPGGLVFITTDFAEDEQDHYRHANLRAGKMFTGRIYDDLHRIGSDMGFYLLDGVSNWVWSEECRLVNDYSFASMALVRRVVS